MSQSEPSSQSLIQRLVPVLFDDDDLLVVDKPSGVDVGGDARPGDAGLIDWLLQVRVVNRKLEPINRLSRYESGILLLGKTPGVVRSLRAARRQGRWEQQYVVVVRGLMRQPTMSVGGSRTPQKAVRSTPGIRKKKSTRTTLDRSQTRLTRLHAGPQRTLVRCRTFVESTHALRARLRSVRLRVLGDRLHEETRRTRRDAQTCLHLARLTVSHPVSKKRVMLFSKPPESFDSMTEGRKDVIRPLRAALTRRLPVLVEPQTDAYRLITGDAEDAPGLVAERFGPVVIVQVHRDQAWPQERVRAVARWYREVLDVQSIYVKRFVRNRADAQDRITETLTNPKPLLGKTQPAQLTIRENGLRLAVRPYDGFSVGLFLNHRDDRARVRKLSDGKDVLNLFAYTCGFSVAAASGGAHRTVSVDLSGKYLEWGKINFALNGLPPENHAFVVDEAFHYLKRAAKKGERFDLIVLDPPTFAHARKRGRDFSITRDLTDLIAEALNLLNPHGSMLISTNCRGLSLQGLRARIHGAAGDRRYKVKTQSKLPIDFASDPDIAKTLWASFVVGKR